jgi:predicted DNA-binding protein
MADEKTTIQLDQETDRKLKAVADALERSKAAQVRYWVNREYAELERLKLLPAEPALKPILE